MNESLKQVEEETAKRLAAEKSAVVAPPVGKDSKKVDPKAAAAAKGGKAPAKGAVVIDDPNSPKDITVDYPDVPSLPDYVVIDKSYH